jgi:hypothetical protein
VVSARAAGSWRRQRAPARRDPVSAACLVAFLVLLGAEARAARITSTWHGGSGSYTDPAAWTFDPPPTAATFPSNDGTDNFEVLIDGGQSGVASAVSLAAPVVIDRLEIDAGDSLTAEDASSLTLVNDAGRPGSGAISNDGTLKLNGGASATQLLHQADLTISGAGALVLSDSTQNRIASTGGLTIFANGVDHRIEGAGSISGYWLDNRGTIAATGANPLNLDFSVLAQKGTLEASGAGGMDLGTLAPENDGTVRSVSGSSISMGRLQNDGLAQVLSGGSITIGGPSPSDSVNNGTLQVTGLGSEASFGRGLLNRGVLELMDGGKVSLQGRFVQDASSAVTRIGRGSVFEVPASSSIHGGLLELNGGTLASQFDLLVSNLSGDGRVSLAGQTLDLDGTASPGISGAGLLEVEGELSFSARMLAELGGTAPSAYDRITATEALSLGSRPTFEVSLLDGYTPGAGDGFDLLTGQTVGGSASLSMFTVLPDLDEGLFWLTGIADGGATQSLRLGVGELLEATWYGGNGSYTDGSLWTFSGTPLSATLPSNDLSNAFHVRIDTQPGTPSAVSLGTDVIIDRLEIDAGDTLTIEDGSSLAIANEASRPGGGVIVNHGTLELNGIASPTELIYQESLTLSGTGVLALSGSSQNRLASMGGPFDTLTNELRHRIEGSGTIESVRIQNRGTIAATGVDPLTISIFGSWTNEGVLEASGQGDLDLVHTRTTATLKNEGVIRAVSGGRVNSAGLLSPGTIEVLSGGQLDVPNLNFSHGSILVSGAGSHLAVSGQLGGGRLEVLSDGRVTTGALVMVTTSDGFVRIADGGRIEVTGLTSYVRRGVLELDGGSVVSASDFAFETPSGASVFLRGNGTFSLPGQTLIYSDTRLGTLAPGLDGMGLLTVDGSFSFESGRFLAELGGTAPAAYDRLTATEAVSIGGGSFEITLVGGFNPSRGDAFDLISGQTLSSAVGAESLFAPLPELRGDVFWFSEFADLGATQSLRLSVTSPIQAFWNGGAGDFADPASWRFDFAPVEATFPSNVGSDVFHVWIDGEGLTGPASVLLATDAIIDALRIGKSDLLAVENGRSLTIQNVSRRSGGGAIVNDGLLVLEGSDAPTSLQHEGNLTISGSGTLRFSDAAHNTISSTPDEFAVALTNDTGHRIEGAGRIESAVLNNRGTIAATGENPLVIARMGEQLGILEASGAGGLEIERTSGLSNELTNEGTIRAISGSLVTVGALRNRGHVEATTGGRLVFSSPFRGISNEAGSHLLVRGAWSELSAASLSNADGLVEILEGGRATVGGFSHLGSSAVTRIGEGSELEITGFGLPRISGGTFEVDGTLRSEVADLSLAGGVLQGNGRIEMAERSLTVGRFGILAPGGVSQAGRFEIVGNLLVDQIGTFAGTLSLEFGGDGDGEFDILLVDGDVSLEGIVDVDLIDLTGGDDPFDPALGTQFDAVFADEFSDIGATFSLPTFDDDRRFVAAIVGAGQVLRFTVVPEPSSATLSLLGLTALAARRRLKNEEARVVGRLPVGLVGERERPRPGDQRRK